MNDEDAFVEIYNTHKKSVLGIALRMLKDPASAEDVLQQTFLNFYRGMGAFRGDSTLSTWLNRITVNVCLGMIHKNRRMVTGDLNRKYEAIRPCLQSLYPNPFESFTASEIRDRIEQTLNHISHGQRAVVRMHDMQGYTIIQIARCLGVPVGTVKSRLFYGRKRFRDCFFSLLH